MCSIVLQPNPPYYSLSHENMFPKLPFCKPPKNPIFITGFSKQEYFSPSYVGFFGFFLLVRVSQKYENLLNPFPFFLPLLFLLLFRLFFFSLLYSLSLTISISISLFLCHLSYLFVLSLEFCFSFLLSSPHDEEDESCCRFHQSFFWCVYGSEIYHEAPESLAGLWRFA